MYGVIFWDTIRQNWKTAFYWGAFFALMSALVVAIIPDVEVLQRMSSGFQNMSPVILAMIGVGNAADLQFFGTPEGYIAFGFFGKMVLFFVVYPLVMGFRVTTNEEDEGILDMVLSLPIPRWQLLIERFLAYVVMNIIVVALIWAGFYLGQVISGIQLDNERIVRSVWNLLPTMIFMLSFTMFLGSVMSRKKYVVVVSLIFLMYSYSLDVVGLMGGGSILEEVRRVSFFAYMDSSGVMQNGITLTNVLGFLIVSAVLVVASTWFFGRRDVGA